MEKITFKRLLRWTLASLIVVVLIAQVFGVGIASALDEVLINENISYVSTGITYTTLGSYAAAYCGSGALPTAALGYIQVNTDVYKEIEYVSAEANLQINDDGGCGSPGNQFVSSEGSFSGGTGIYGKYVDLEIKIDNIHYAYGSIGWSKDITGKPHYEIYIDDINHTYALTLTGSKQFTLSYDTTVFTNYITFDRNDYSGAHTGTASNVNLFNVQGNAVVGRRSSTTSLVWNYAASDHLNIRAINSSNQFVKFNVTKYGYNFRTIITNGSGNIYYNVTDATNIIEYQINKLDGLIIKLKSTATSVEKSRNIYGITSPTVPLTPIINPITGAGIIFDQADYSVGDIANISWARTSGSVPLLCTDYIRRTYPDGSKTTIITSPGDTGHTKETLNDIGLHGVVFERECLIQTMKTLSSDSASVNPDGNSYILAKSPQGAGIAFNVTYAFGYTPVAQGELNSIVVEKLTGDKWEWNHAFSLNNSNIVKNTEYNLSIVVGDIGKYKIKLFELRKGYVANVIIDSIAVDIPIIKNISVSRIEVDKVEYLRSDPIDIYYAIDNYNYSNYYSKYISVIHSSGNYPETSHKLVTEQEKTTYYASSSAILQNARSGLNYVRLRAKNLTSDIILANTSFNISFVDGDGYGLYVADAEVCRGESIVIRYATAPGNNTLRVNTIGDVDVFPLKYYEQKINGSGSISLKLTKISDYQILIYETNVGNVKKFTTAKATDCSTATNGTEDNWGNGGNSYTCGFWDGWVGNLAGGQGINDLTRFEFALLVIGMITAFTTIITKNLGAGIITGFFPYAFFVFISLSTPCGQYMPIWTAVFIAVIVGIKMRWF